MLYVNKTSTATHVDFYRVTKILPPPLKKTTTLFNSAYSMGAWPLLASLVSRLTASQSTLIIKLFSPDCPADDRLKMNRLTSSRDCMVPPKSSHCPRTTLTTVESCWKSVMPEELSWDILGVISSSTWLPISRGRTAKPVVISRYSVVDWMTW